jgi:hypothetical protein
VVGAVGGHLPVVDLGELRVQPAGDLGGADKLIAKLGRTSLGDRLALAVGLSGL